MYCLDVHCPWSRRKCSACQLKGGRESKYATYNNFTAPMWHLSNKTSKADVHNETISSCPDIQSWYQFEEEEPERVPDRVRGRCFLLQPAFNMFQVAPESDSRAADITPQQHIASTHHHNTQQKITQSHVNLLLFLPSLLQALLPTSHNTWQCAQAQKLQTEHAHNWNIFWVPSNDIPWNSNPHTFIKTIRRQIMAL